MSRVIQSEQKSLEEQGAAKVEEVNLNTIALANLNKELHGNLSPSTGDILDKPRLSLTRSANNSVLWQAADIAAAFTPPCVSLALENCY